MKQVKCKGCGELIFFVKTENGKSMPLDVKGQSFYIETESLTGWRGWQIMKGYVPHWATCKKAKDFKKTPPKKEVIDKLEAGDHGDQAQPDPTEPIDFGESHKWTSIPVPVRKCKSTGHEPGKKALGNFNYEIRCEPCNYVYRYQGAG